MEDDDHQNASLVRTLNSLFVELGLNGIEIEHPSDLTSSILLAILECLIRERLPIPASIRDSRTAPDRIEAMKVFLGVLTDDMLTQSGFGQTVINEVAEIDPRQLASGEDEECFVVGEVLCRLAKEMGLLADAKVQAPSPPRRRRSPSPDVFGGGTTSTLPRAPSPSSSNGTGSATLIERDRRATAHKSRRSSSLGGEMNTPTFHDSPSPASLPRHQHPNQLYRDVNRPRPRPSTSQRADVCIHELHITPPTSPSAHARSLAIFDDEDTAQEDDMESQDVSHQYHATSTSFAASSSTILPSHSHSVCTCDKTMSSEADTSLYCTCGHVNYPPPPSRTPSPSPSQQTFVPIPFDVLNPVPSTSASSYLQETQDRSIFAHPSRVRYGGQIAPVPPEHDVEEFQRAHGRRLPSDFPQERKAAIPTRHTSPSEHRLALLNERARLYAEIARIKSGAG